MDSFIRGFIEIRDKESKNWLTSSYNLANLGLDSYTILGFLFGVQNYTGLVPIASNRELPLDISDTTKREYEQDKLRLNTYGNSWINWKELEQIEWDQIEVEYILEFETLEENLEYLGAWVGRDPRLRLSEEQWRLLENDKILYRDDHVLKIESDKLEKVLTREWKYLFFKLKKLALANGSENVRLVVWFYNG